MVGKLDKIPQFGEEPATFAKLLRPIVIHLCAKPSISGADEPEKRAEVDHITSPVGSPPFVSGMKMVSFYIGMVPSASLLGNHLQAIRRVVR